MPTFIKTNKQIQIN